MSMNGFGVAGFLAFFVLLPVVGKAFYEKNDGKRWSIRFPAMLFALFMTVGYSFHMSDSYYVPVYVNFAILTTKDVMYSAFLLWYVLFLSDLLLVEEKWSVGKKAAFVMACLLCIYMRHNGIYVILLSLPFVLFKRKNLKKPVMGVMALLAVLYLFVVHVIYPACRITAGSPRGLCRFRCSRRRGIFANTGRN